MTKYIAEIGLNHLGDPKLGFQLVKKAVASGVDGVSIQFMPESYYDNSKPWRRKINSKFYKKISDFHIRAGSPLAYRQTGEIHLVKEVVIKEQDINSYIRIY